MSQHDFNIANQTAAPARADINSALTALASLSSGATAPSTTVANMLWYDTSTNTLKLRNEADSGWISIGYADQSSGAFALFDNAKVVNTSGTQTGLIGDQATSAWVAGTSTTESLVSPAKVKAAVQALTPAPVMEVIAAAKMNAVDVNPPTTYFDTGFASISRINTADYQFTFTTARSSLDYVVSGWSHGTISRTPSIYDQTNSGFKVAVRVMSSANNVDVPFDVIVHALPS